jgi:hypothetical protein
VQELAFCLNVFATETNFAEETMNLRRLFLFTLVLAAAACLLTSTTAFAQSLTTGEITGTVADPSGAVLPSVTVTLKSVEKGFTQSGTTNTQGAYRFALLSPGNYTVSATASGFKTTTETTTVAVGAVAITNIKLEVGSTATTVEVTGEAPLLQTDSSEIATTMNTLAVQTLPNPGNDLSFIAQTAPGSTMNTQGGYGNFSSFGISATSNLFTLNGMYDNDPFLNLNNSGATNLLLGNNEVQEATVVSNGYSGQYGGFAGAQVNYVTKSGSNQWHGNAAYWWNGRVMNANDWFNNNTYPTKTPRAFDNANQYAASFGGPIKKDKAFFFFNYEGLRVLIPVSNTVTFPSPAFQTATLANLGNIYSGSDLATETAFYKNMFSLYNGAKDVGRATPVTANNGGCGTLAIPGVSTCADTYVSNAGQLTHEYLLAGRFDFNLTKNDKFFIRMQEDKGLQATFTDPINSLFNTTSNQPEYQSQASWNHSFGIKAVNNLVASMTYYSAIFLNANRAATLAAFPGTMVMGDSSFINSGNPAGGTLGGEDFIFPQGRNVTQYQFVDDFSYSLGTKHTLKLGENFHRYDIGDHDSGFYVAPITIPFTIGSFYDGGADGVLNIAGYPAKSAFPVAIYGLGWYVQDEWRATPGLKLTFDLRMDHPSNPTSGLDPFSRFVTSFDQLNHSASIPYNQALTSALNTPIQSLTGVAWQPRFGFAWTPPGLKNTVLRGGIGMFSDTFPGVVADGNGFNPPFANYFTVVGTAMAPGVTSGCSLPTLFPCDPYTIGAKANTAFVNGFNSGGTLATVGVTPNVNSANKIKVPMYEEWNFEVEQQLGNNTSFSINYVGNHGYHETVVNNGVNAFCPTSVCPTGFAGLPAAPTDPRWLTVAQTSTEAVSNYNGMVVSVQHRFSHGLQLQGNFTWSHALDEISNGGELGFNGATAGSLLNPVNPFNLRANYGNADYDTRKYASISYVYQMPHWWGPKVLTDGWQFSGTVFTRSGLPFTVIDHASSVALSGTGYGGTAWAGYSGAAQPSCGAGAASAVNGAEKSPCLTEAGFTPVVLPVTTLSGAVIAPNFSFGTQRKNQFFGPSYFNTDFTVMKFFGIPHWERGKLGVGAQFFNFFNHTNFDDPVRDVSNVGQFGQITRDLSTPTSILGSFLGANASPRLVQLTAKFNF